MAETPMTEWASGVLDCFEDASTCCYGFWCSPCLACTVSGRLGENNCLPLCDFFSCTAFPYCMIPVAIHPANLAMRVAMRNRYNIKGSICKDMAVSCCCSWCSWCQMHRELKERKKTPTVINVQAPMFVSSQPTAVAMSAYQPLVYSPNQSEVTVDSQ